MSYSSDGKLPGSWAVEPSTINFTNPTGACGIENCPCASTWTEGAVCVAFAFECITFVSTARMVTPGIGALLLSRTTPEIVVLTGSPGARPDAVNAAGDP